MWGNSFPIQGRYATGGDSPYNIPANNAFTARTLGSCTSPRSDRRDHAQRQRHHSGHVGRRGSAGGHLANMGDPLIAYKQVDAYSVGDHRLHR